MFLSSLLVVVVMVVTVTTVSEYFIHNQDGVIMARAGEKVGGKLIQAIVNYPIMNCSRCGACTLIQPTM